MYCCSRRCCQKSLQFGPECLPKKSGPNFLCGDSATGRHTVVFPLQINRCLLGNLGAGRTWGPDTETKRTQRQTGLGDKPNSGTYRNWRLTGLRDLPDLGTNQTQGPTKTVDRPVGGTPRKTGLGDQPDLGTDRTLGPTGLRNRQDQPDRGIYMNLVIDL